MKTPAEKLIISFKNPRELRTWLLKNHSKSDGIWFRIFKKSSGTPSITYDEALDEALCMGWIDGQKKSCDEKSWLQKFTPRRAKSIWSKRNKEHIARLIKEHRMHASGMKEVAAAKTDGRWESAYDSPKNMNVPEDFLKELKKDTKAYNFFLTLNKANLYAIGWRLQTAKKPETRAKRLSDILQMMRDEKKFH